MTEYAVAFPSCCRPVLAVSPLLSPVMIILKLYIYRLSLLAVTLCLAMSVYI